MALIRSTTRYKHTGQVLANMAAMGSDKFASERLPGGKVVGKFDMSKVNTRGGSLALGHPFGATGTHRMRVGKRALVRVHACFCCTFRAGCECYFLCFVLSFSILTCYRT
jgi:ribosomal protein S6E (S10)